MASWINPATGQWDDNYHAQQEALERGESGGGGGGSRSAAGVDLSQVPSVSQYIEGQFATEDKALQDLVTQMMGREKPLDIYGRLEKEAGLPELRGVSTSLSKEIGSIEDYLDQIEPDVSARTRESLVTEAQRRGMVATGREPFLQKLTKLGTALGRVSGRVSEAERGIATKTELGMRGQEMDIEPLQLRYQVMVDRNARKLTGFTADRQTQLDALYDKLQRQRTLDDQDWQLAKQLDQEENSYIKSLKTSAAQAGVTLSGNESADDILGLIGKTAAESIQWERNYKTKTAGGTGTAGERQQAAALVSLRKDIQSYAGFEDLVRRYGETVPIYQIREEYNSFHTGSGGEPWGPAQETESQVQQWMLKPKEEGGETIEIQREDGTIIRI